MRLVFLGTTGYHPNADRHTACLMLPDLGIVLDAGTGFFRVRDYLQTPELHIYLTHAHLDHVVGLTYLPDVVRDKPVADVVVYGAAEHLAAVREHLFSELLFPARFAYRMQALDEHRSRQGAPFSILGAGTGQFRWQQHPGGSLGYRFSWSQTSLAYITDTVADDETAEFVRGVDVLIHECYFPDEWKDRAEATGHSYSSAVAELARGAGVGRLCVVHTDPLAPGPDPVGIDRMREIFPAIHLAHDLLEIEF